MKTTIQGRPTAEKQRGQATDWRRQACVDAAGGEPLMFIDGHDDAIVGVAELDGEPRVVYDNETIIRKLMRRDGMDREGALEFFEYNIASLRLGPRPPWLFISFIATTNAATGL